jgi:hypothetical protein
MAKTGKKVQTYYLKQENIDWLNQKAFEKSTANDRVTDDALLDEILDAAREADQSPTPTKKKARLVAEPVAA